MPRTLAALTVVMAAACGAAPDAASTTTGPPTTTTSTPSTTATTEALPVFASETYPFSIPYDPAITTPRPARGTWDFEEPIGHTIGTIDYFDLPGGGWLFFYGSPTDDTLGGFADLVQSQRVRDRGCPEDPSIRRATLDGAEALVYDQECSGMHIQVVVSKRDGFGLVGVMGTPAVGGDEEADRAEFKRLISTVRWLEP